MQVYTCSAWFSVIGHSVSTWTGLNDLNQLNSYEWSDGTPFAFINWRDNGNFFNYLVMLDIFF